MQDLSFDKFVHEAHDYFNDLAAELGHPEEKKRTVILWKAVMHTLRDRMHMSESFDLISQLPLILKSMYVEEWKYQEGPIQQFDTIDGMKEAVKALQEQYGETQFSWEKHTDELFSITLDSLKRYFSEGQMDHIRAQMPQEIKELVG
jgi:uncharacterized protein (DUF2267 family)